jgi:hypothetical protein
VLGIALMAAASVTVSTNSVGYGLATYWSLAVIVNAADAICAAIRERR